ncbi:MAG TPA: tRNA lysidine(34) synthetase TilS [Spirochaetia bacterium]|nr:tRNA lysidine(34) synthetase TilS [Spirochaetia bacterium]
MSSIEKTLTKRVEDYFASLKIQPGTAILVGVSGGPDSVALLSLLSGLQFYLFCGYVDHGMRPADERANDRSFLESFCSGLSVPFLSRSIPERSIESKASKSGRSTEDVARELRYSLLEQMRREAKASCIAVGHNRDDQFETMIMRFFMGSGPEGLKGIPKCRGNIIRPLLRVSRAEILAYLEEHGISYRTDSTNLESMYLRNKIRLTLIPEVRRIFPGYGRALESLSEKMACIEDFLKYTTRLH